MAAVETIQFDFDIRGALSALRDLQGAQTKVEGGAAAFDAALKKVENTLVNVSDKAAKATLKHVEALEKQNAAMAKSPLEKNNALRDLEIRKIQQSTLAIEDQAKAIRKVNALFDERARMLKGGGPGDQFKNIGETVKNFVENPMQSAGSALSSFAGKLGMIGAVAAGAVTAVAAVAATMFEFAKEAGAEAEALVNLSDRTGISVRRLDELSAMAKIANVDINSLGRAAGSLAIAVDGSGEKADKARRHLLELGVTTHDLQGNTRELEAIVVDVLGALANIPDPTKRIATAFETIGKKPAQELLPLIKNLGELQETVRQLGYGLDENGIRKSAEFDDQLDKLELRWGQVKRELAKPVNAVFEFVFGPVSTSSKNKGLIDYVRQLNREFAHGGEYTDPDEIAAKKQKYRDEDAAYQKQQHEKSLMPAAEAYAASVPKDKDYWQNNLIEAKKKVRDLDAALRGPLEVDARKDNEAKIKQARAEVVEAEAHIKALGDEQSITERLRQERDKAIEGELSGTAKINQAYRDKIAYLKDIHQYVKGGVNERLVQETRDAQIAAYNKDTERQLADTGFTGQQTRLRGAVNRSFELSQAQRRWSGLEDEGTARSAIDQEYAKEQALNESSHAEANRRMNQLLQEGKVREGLDLREKERVRYEEAADQAKLRRTIAQGDLDKKLSDEADARAKAKFENQTAYDQMVARIDEQRARSATQYNIALRQQMAHRVVGSERGLAAAEEQDQIAAANDQFQRAKALIELERTAVNTRFNKPDSELTNDQRIQKERELQALIRDGVQASGELQAEIDQAHRDYTMRTIELWNKQYDEIKGKTEGLLHTLFTDPKNFGSQLKTTVRDAALKPIEDRLSSVIAGQIQSVLFGKNAPTAKLSDIQGIGKVNDALKVFVTNAGTGSTSVVQQTLPTPFNAIGSMIPGISSVPAGVTSQVFTPLGTGPEAAPQNVGGAYWAGSPGGFASGTVAGVPGIGGVPAGGIAGMISRLPGYSSGTGGFKDIFGNLKGINWGGFTRRPVAIDNGDFGGEYDDSVDPSVINSGKITGVNGVAGTALVAGGSYLAERGLMGKDAGTWSGVGEGAIGGGAIGLRYGGALGAGIGAGIGAAIGLGEKAAGVESKTNEAKRLIKERYGVRIDDALAGQIVQLAVSKYAGHVSLAVRDPDTQRMISLYASGTNQRVPLSLMTPRAASLEQTRSGLAQAATYQYGNAYTYQSSLPVAGGVQTTNYPSQPMSLQVNISGKGADQFLRGSVVTPEFVSSQWATSQQFSNSRVQNAATMQSPGLIVR